MKTSNIEPSGQRSAAATRGSRSTNLAGSKGIVFRDPVTESVGQLRDITLQGITLTDNDDGTGVLTVAAGGGTGTPPWFNVMDYGAVGDGVTVDCAAINAAIAAINLVGRGVLYFPPGTYYCNAGLTTITVSCAVRGEGWTGAGNQQSVILLDNTTANLFTVSAAGCSFSNLGLVQDNGPATATAGAAISMSTADLADFDRLYIAYFYNGLDLEAARRWAMRRCYIDGVANYGLKVRNTAAPDSGDWLVMGTIFAQSAGPAVAAIRQESAGGGRIIGNKVNGNASGANRYTYGIDVSIGTGADTSVMIIEGNSLENMTTDAIRIVTSGSGTFGLVDIIGNQSGLYGNNAGRSVNLSGAGLTGVLIADNIWSTNGTARAAVSVTNSTNVRIGPNVLNGFNAEYTNSGGTIIDDTGAIGAGVAISGTPSANQVPIASSGTAAAWGTLGTSQLQNAGHWETIVAGSAPPVAVTNEAADDWLVGWVPGS